MSNRVIRVGDLTSQGGKVLASSAPHFTVDGIAVALVGAPVPARAGRPTDLLTSPIPLESQMSLKIITVGDKTDHGGTVISGSPNHDLRGRAIARLGDKVDCPQPYPGGKPHGVNKIITAHDTLTVDGVPVAVEGCTTECGCKLIGSLPATVG